MGRDVILCYHREKWLKPNFCLGPDSRTASVAYLDRKALEMSGIRSNISVRLVAWEVAEHVSCRVTVPRKSPDDEKWFVDFIFRSRRNGFQRPTSWRRPTTATTVDVFQHQKPQTTGSTDRNGGSWLKKKPNPPIHFENTWIEKKEDKTKSGRKERSVGNKMSLWSAIRWTPYLLITKPQVLMSLVSLALGYL